MKTKKLATLSIKYFTKLCLQEAARNAEKWDLNRQLDLDAINTYPDDALYPVVNTMHHHREDPPAPPHVRLFVAVDAVNEFAVDVPMEFWNGLPEFQLQFGVRSGSHGMGIFDLRILPGVAKKMGPELLKALRATLAPPASGVQAAEHGKLGLDAAAANLPDLAAILRARLGIDAATIAAVSRAGEMAKAAVSRMAAGLDFISKIDVKQLEEMGRASEKNTAPSPEAAAAN